VHTDSTNKKNQTVDNGRKNLFHHEAATEKQWRQPEENLDEKDTRIPSCKNPPSVDEKYITHEHNEEHSAKSNHGQIGNHSNSTHQKPASDHPYKTID
jgi:hypothetical protein